MNYLHDAAGELVRFYSEGDFKDEALLARKQFSDFVGVLDEDNPSDDMKFNQFADWYLFIRKLSKIGKTPLEHQQENQACPLNPELTKAIQNLSDSRFSLFEFLKIKKQDVYLKDLVSGYKLIIKDSQVIHGFEPNTPFSARLIPYLDSYTFSSAFCFHPKEAQKFINSEVKRVHKIKDQAEQAVAREDLMLSLLRMKHRYDHFKKMPCNEIYTNDSKLRF